MAPAASVEPCSTAPPPPPSSARRWPTSAAAPSTVPTAWTCTRRSSAPRRSRSPRSAPERRSRWARRRRTPTAIRWPGRTSPVPRWATQRPSATWTSSPSDAVRPMSEARASGGGAISVGLTNSIGDYDPIVEAYIGTGTTIAATGNVTVKALLSAAPAAGAPSDEITAVSSATDVVTFAFPVSDGDVVRYLVGTGFTPDRRRADRQPRVQRARQRAERVDPAGEQVRPVRRRRPAPRHHHVRLAAQLPSTATASSTPPAPACQSSPPGRASSPVRCSSSASSRSARSAASRCTTPSSSA